MGRVDDILELIDGALGDDSSVDSMRWSPDKPADVNESAPSWWISDDEICTFTGVTFEGGVVMLPTDEGTIRTWFESNDPLVPDPEHEHAFDERVETMDAYRCSGCGQYIGRCELDEFVRARWHNLMGDYPTA